jgi:hypothetical protein
MGVMRSELNIDQAAFVVSSQLDVQSFKFRKKDSAESFGVRREVMPRTPCIHRQILRPSSWRLVVSVCISRLRLFPNRCYDMLELGGEPLPAKLLNQPTVPIHHEEDGQSDLQHP